MDQRFREALRRPAWPGASNGQQLRAVFAAIFRWFWYSYPTWLWRLHSHGFSMAHRNIWFTWVYLVKMGWSFHGKLLNNQMVHGNDCPPWNQHEKHENRLDFFWRRRRSQWSLIRVLFYPSMGVMRALLCEDGCVKTKMLFFCCWSLLLRTGPPYVGKLVYNGANYG